MSDMQSSSRAAAQKVMFRPTVVLGLGGMGTFIAYRVMQLVKEQLDRQVGAGLITAEMRALALGTRFKFLGVDSDRPEYVDALDDFLHIGTAENPNGSLDTNYLLDPDFKTWWWKDRSGNWWMPGNFEHGCGNVRLKGRLAYFLERQHRALDAEEIIKDAVKNSVAIVEELDLPPNEATTVFVCASLSGGTGGGTFLSVLNSIKDIPRTRTYGVVIGASIACQQAAHNRLQAQQANFRAGLVELEAWMNPDPSLREAAGWQVYWPAGRDTIAGARPPADIVWLFDEMSIENRAMPSQMAAINTAADAVASWIHSSCTAATNSLDSDTMMTVNNMAANLSPTVGRSIRYGAMGVAHLAFDADRALDYLSAILALDAIRDRVLARQKGTQEQGRDLRDEFCRDMEIIEKGQDQILDKLRGFKKQLPPAPALSASLRRAPSSRAYAAIVKSAVENLAAPDGRLAAYRATCAEWVGERLDGPADDPGKGLRNQLRAKVSKIIGGSPSGFALASEFLEQLCARIEGDEAASIENELGTEKPPESRPWTGARADRARYEASRSQEIKGFASIIPGRTEARIREFAAGWWKNWIDTNDGIIDHEAALDLYDELGEEIKTQQRAMKSVRTALDSMAASLRTREARALLPPPLAERGGITGYVLTTDHKLLRQTFPWTEEDADAVAQAFGTDPENGLAALFEECLTNIRVLAAAPDPRSDRKHSQYPRALAQRRLDSALTDSRFRARLDELCREKLQKAIAEFTVWDALQAEAENDSEAKNWADLEQYVSKRLDARVDASAPMFPLDAQKCTDVGLDVPDESIYVVANAAAATAFAARNGDSTPDTWLEDGITRRLHKKFQTVDTVDHQRVSLVRRVVGFPLLAAHQGWGAADARSLAAQEGISFPWSDARAQLLPRDFEPLDATEIAYVAALAIDEKIVISREDGCFEFPVRRLIADGPDGLLATLLRDRQKFLAIATRTGEALSRRSREDWEQKFPDLLTLLEDRKKATRDRSPDARALTRMIDAVNARYDQLVQTNAGPEEFLPLAVRLPAAVLGRMR